MDTLDAILTRRTVPPAKMGPPGPDAAALRRILEAGAAAPDHGLLRPWRFLVVRGEGRERLGELFAAMAERAGAAPEEAAKQRAAPARAPLILVAAAKVRPDHPKIPAVEQVASAAAAVQNMLLAAGELGLAAMWRTGGMVDEPEVLGALGVEEGDAVVAFVYVGRPVEPPGAPTPRPPLEDVVEWRGSWG
jgi:nitroreductase